MSQPNIRPNTRLVTEPTRGQTAATVAEAAERLGTTSDAIRMRLKRGVLAGAKVGGHWVVYLETDESAVQQERTPDRTLTQQATQHPNTADLTGVIEAKDETISRLDAEVGFLREQLDQRTREAEQIRRDQAAERERFDVIHREALQRIEALTAGDYANASDEQDPSRAGYADASDVPARDQRTAPTMAPERAEPPESTPDPDTSHEPSIVAGWLRRVFGRS